jgi:hypothetical protein
MIRSAFTDILNNFTLNFYSFFTNLYICFCLLIFLFRLDTDFIHLPLEIVQLVIWSDLILLYQYTVYVREIHMYFDKMSLREVIL